MEATVEEVAMRQPSDEVFGGIIPTKEALRAIHLLEKSGSYLVAARSSTETAQKIRDALAGYGIRNNACEVPGIHNGSLIHFQVIFVGKSNQ